MASDLDVDSSLKIRLPNNDAQIQKFESLRDAELAKGSDANHEKLLAFIEVINIFVSGSTGAVLRISARERTHKANDQQEILIGSHRNWSAKALQSVGGSIGVTGAVFVAVIAIGGSLAGVPPAAVQTLVTWASGILTAATQGFSSLGSAAQAGDQADINKYGYAVTSEQTEARDDQTTREAVEQQKSTAMRRMIESHQQADSAWKTAASASR
ncbi:MAG: hypothetical protein H0T62_04750 [Parachlamydiaceae bacterium]|nr:hypothetical protein [Parachlamydiaceae bacterium]